MFTHLGVLILFEIPNVHIPLFKCVIQGTEKNLGIS